jgi:GNAT superfamily N-acetyltransferase
VSETPSLPIGFSTRAGEVEVRAAVGEDFGELERLLGFLVLGQANPTVADRDAFVRTLGDPQRMVLVAARDDRLVGTLDLIVVDNVTHAGAPWAAIENVVVDPGERRKGIARAMLDAAVVLARGAGCYKIQLLSDSQRSDAHAMYERVGFDYPVRGFRRYL